MSDYRPTQADREAAKAICEQFFIVLGNDERTHKLIAAIMAKKMQPERAAADSLADAVELEFKGELKDPNDMFDALYAYREATK
jgi:hypothetical protein